jgi:hypothetical protein
MAQAEVDCQVSLNYGMVVTDKQIRVLDEGGRTVYQINDGSQLFVEGQWLDLTSQQTQELTLLAEGVHGVVPQMILLANEGVVLAIETIEQVYSGLVKDDTSQKKLQKSLDRVKTSVQEKFIRANDNFYMGPGSLEQVDDFVDRELEQEIDEAMSTSVGGILSAIGGLVAKEQSTEGKMEAIVRHLEGLGEDIQENVGPRAQSLKQKARWFCNQFNELDKIEEQLRASILPLSPYNVLSTEAPNEQ